MTRKVSFTPAALRDAGEAYDWYAERSAQAEQRFRESLRACVAMIREHPNAFYRMHGVYRGVRVPRFPYVLVYAAEENTIWVVGVVHTSLGPDAWRERFGEA